MFSALDEATIRSLVDRCRTVKYPAGEVIFLSGRAADKFYVILAGKVAVYKLSPAGERQIIHLYSRGESFAGAAMFSGGGYPASAEATEDAELLEISRAALEAAFAAEPRLAMGMLAGLSKKLRELVALVEDLSLRSVPARLGRELLEEAARSGGRQFRLSASKHDLAAKLGTVPETLSRALAKLRKDGLIEVKGRNITILDRAGLENLAGQEDT